MGHALKRPRLLIRSLLAAWAGAAVLGGGLGWLYWEHVVRDPGEHVTPEYVMGVIAQESPVFYRDGRTRIGVFFEDEHRTFVPWERIPTAYAAALVAAEDDTFWSHRGISPEGVARAVLSNLQAGRVVSGGSTLTQQTAKNLYYRPDRSVRSKLIEALNALRLEHHFDKERILTFYVNQFHVAGNGRGLGIAARHFFDKEVEELSVLESAFLAGLVKAPAHYDPFGGGEARRAAASERAQARTRYVLERLVAEPARKLAGPPPARGDAAGLAAFERRVEEVEQAQAEARRLLDEGFALPFKRGVFRYESNAVLDEVARRLAEPPFDEVFEAAGIDDPRTAGLQVVTTLDPVAQRAATYGLWHHLTDVGLVMEGRGADAFLLEEGQAPRFDPDHPPRPWEFRTARVTSVEGGPGKRHAVVDLGGHACTVDRAAMVRAAVGVRRAEVRSLTAKSSTAAVDAFAEGLAPGSVVWVSVREVTDGGAICDLEVRPELQGAAVVVRDGELLAMVGGNDNRNFNRATALRQMGSTWKTVVYHAALELGWDPTDALDNRRAVFPFSTTFYWPSPDHAAPDEVSLAWAGTKSENLATVWLLYHLTDRLDHDAVHELAVQLDLARREDESATDYRDRIQRAGVLPMPSRARESLFLQARREVLASLDQTAHPEDAVALASLLYGWGFDAERRRVGADWQVAALRHSWLQLEAERARCGELFRRVVPVLEEGLTPPPLGDALSFRRTDDVIEVACGATPEGYGPLTPELLTPVTDGFLGVLMPRRPRFADEQHMRVGPRLHASTLDAVASALERRVLAREVAGGEAPGLYDPEILYWHQDFRVLLAMRYVIALAEAYGVRTELDDVLSLPLGAAEVTLEELTMVYEGLVTGQTWAFSGEGGGLRFGEPPASALLIREIRDVDGQVLYRARPEPVPVASRDAAHMTGDILRAVVGHGTGRRAKGAITLGGAALPVGGKTGTTNDFRNAAFLGALPVVDGDAVGREEIVVGVYVGYDDNREMRRGGVRLGGANGALPAWISIGRGLAAGGLLGATDVRAPAEGWEIPSPPGLVPRAVDPVRGLPAEDEGLPTVLSRPHALPDPAPADIAHLDTRRRIRVAPRTVDAERWRERREERLRRRAERADVWSEIEVSHEDAP